jgi:hypothetical protein
VLILAAPGPSLTPTVQVCTDVGWPIATVGDAHRLFPSALWCLHSDLPWWRKYSHDVHCKKICPNGDHHDIDQRRELRSLGVELVDVPHGVCSGYAAIRYALQEHDTVALIGYDMRSSIDGKTHFYGRRADGLRDPGEYGLFIEAFRHLPRDRIVNATPGSALPWFRHVSLEELL